MADSAELFPRAGDARDAGGSRSGESPHTRGAHAGERFDPDAPLAERMRPRTLDELLGQEHLTAPGAPLRALLERGALPSMLLWGPPGSGKTTLARLLASSGAGRVHYVARSAVMAGLRDVREVVAFATRARASGQRTLFFLDEIHRFNRTQQDALLPHVEAGTLTLVGATTENPSFEVISPLLSRCRVFTTKPLAHAHTFALLRRACALPGRGLGGFDVEDDALAMLAHAADGDARRALGLLETAAAWQQTRSAPQAPGNSGAAPQAAGDARATKAASEGARAPAAPPFTRAELTRVLGVRTPRYDRDREQHYDLISAFIKSLRASDPDAALYYMARMLAGGEDPLYIARRLLIFASEDVGNADPAGLPLALATAQTLERIGLPEGRLALAQGVCYLACAPKSNRSLRALLAAERAARDFGAAEVPLHLRNAPTRLMRELGYGEGYEYPHDAPELPRARNLPEAVSGAPWYLPSEHGAERALGERLRRWRKKRKPDAGPD